MICQKCHKNIATIRYAEVIEGKVSERMICPACHQRMEQESRSGFEIAGAAPSPKRMAATRASDVRMTEKFCPACGAQRSDVLKEGKVGCGDCYASFRDDIAQVLHGMHISLQHKGKTLHLNDLREQLRQDLRSSRGLLRSALKTENYEDAAVLRDRIRELEEDLAGQASE